MRTGERPFPGVRGVGTNVGGAYICKCLSDVRAP
jgi:hypothetical protein